MAHLLALQIRQRYGKVVRLVITIQAIGLLEGFRILNVENKYHEHFNLFQHAFFTVFFYPCTLAE